MNEVHIRGVSRRVLGGWLEERTERLRTEPFQCDGGWLDLDRARRVERGEDEGFDTWTIRGVWHTLNDAASAPFPVTHSGKFTAMQFDMRQLDDGRQSEMPRCQIQAHCVDGAVILKHLFREIQSDIEQNWPAEKLEKRGMYWETPVGSWVIDLDYDTLAGIVSRHLDTASSLGLTRAEPKLLPGRMLYPLVEAPSDDELGVAEVTRIGDGVCKLQVRYFHEISVRGDRHERNDKRKKRAHQVFEYLFHWVQDEMSDAERVKQMQVCGTANNPINPSHVAVNIGNLQIGGQQINAGRDVNAGGDIAGRDVEKGTGPQT
jgi:hypothetical protein